MADTTPRRDRYLNEIIESLNQPLIQSGNDIREAWSRLSGSEMEWISQEVEKCLDTLYFLENYYLIRTEQGVIKTFFPLMKQQEIAYEVIIEEQGKGGQCLVIILKPRQTGISTLISAWMFHRTVFQPHTYTMSMAHDKEASTNIYKMMVRGYDFMPWWMKPGITYNREGEYIEFQNPDEKQRITNPGLGSAIQIANAQRMTGVAIGRTIRNLHASEVAKWPENSGIFTSDIEPSMNALDEFGVMESTAFGRNGLFYNHWRGSEAGDTGWRPLFIPVYKCPKYFLPVKQDFRLTEEEEKFNEKILREEKYAIRNTFWAWRRRRLRGAIASTGAPWEHYEAYPITPLEAFQSSGICAFDRNSLMYQLNTNCCKPIRAGEISLVEPFTAGIVNTDLMNEVADDEQLPLRKGEKGDLKHDRLWVWELPEAGETYYVSGDTGLGVQDGDYSVCEVFRCGVGRDPDVQVAEWWGHCPPHQFAQICAALGYWYKSLDSSSEVAVEYQGPGITTGDKLVDPIEYPNLYRPRHKDRVSNQFTPFFHWLTTMKTRDLLITTMNEALLARSVIIRSEMLIDEMFDFASLGGRFEGQENHDDGVMSAQICLYCLRETTNHVKSAASDSRKERSAPGDINQYGVFDNLMRQRGMYQDRAIADKMIEGKKGWKVQPVLICNANTLTSPIYDRDGAEHQLRFKHGVPAHEILPELVSSYRQAMNRPSFANDGDESEEW